MGKHVVSELFEERPLESAGPKLRQVGVDDAHLDSGLKPSDSNGLGQIRVVADHHRCIATMPERVKEQISGDVDVGALFLGLPNFNGLRPTLGRICQRHTSAAGDKMAFVDLDERGDSEGAEESVLAVGLLRIIRA